MMDAAGQLEEAIEGVRVGTMSKEALTRLLAGATLFVPSRQEVRADGGGLAPVVFDHDGAPLAAAFTSLERAGRGASGARFCLQIAASGLLPRLPPGCGLVINPNQTAVWEVPAAEVQKMVRPRGPSRRPAADYVEALIRYGMAYDPGFVATLRAASAREIADLEGQAGRPLPWSYRAYLERMGHGGPRIVLDGTADIGALTAFYRQAAAAGAALPQGLLLIGLGEQARSVGLQDAPGAVPAQDEPQVVLVRDRGVPVPVVGGVFADSLDKLLFRSAFYSCRVAAFADLSSYQDRDPAPRLEAARHAAARLGFAEQWFSDSVVFCAEAEAAALSVSQYEGEGLTIRLWTPGRERGALLLDSFVRALAAP